MTTLVEKLGHTTGGYPNFLVFCSWKKFPGVLGHFKWQLIAHIVFLSCPHQIGCLAPVALHGKSMKKGQKKLLYQLSVELTVCTGEMKQLCSAIFNFRWTVWANTCVCSWQQAYLPMGKQAVERLTQWRELLSIACWTSMITLIRCVDTSQIVHFHFLFCEPWVLNCLCFFAIESFLHTAASWKRVHFEILGHRDIQWSCEGPSEPWLDTS